MNLELDRNMKLAKYSSQVFFFFVVKKIARIYIIYIYISVCVKIIYKNAF